MLQFEYLFLPAIAALVQGHAAPVFPDFHRAGVCLDMNLHADLQRNRVSVGQNLDAAHAVHRGKARPRQVHAFRRQRQQMLLLDQQCCADTLISPSDTALLVASAVVTQTTIQFRQVDSLRHGHPVVSSKVASFAFNSTLLMPFIWCAELAVESPVRPECDEPRRLFPALPAQNLLYRRLQIVVPEFAENPTKESKC